MSKGRILVVDDEANARQALAEILRDESFDVETAADAFKALPKVADFAPELVLTDLKMPGADGVEFMQKVHEHDPEIGVVIMTAFGAVESAVKAMQAGAADYLTKPLNVDALLVVVNRTLERRRLRQQTQHLQKRLSERYSFDNIVGESPELRAIFNAVEQVAPSRASVLLTGESGTGKELVAAAIHQHSGRARGPFVKLHCASLAESLLESELFGHERGAFTGADRRREGRFEHANGGTLFLDEVGEIPPATQVKLLRVLQEREFERVGGNQTIRTDVRLIAATNRNLLQMVEEGRFRQDLYYRLNVVSLRMPALRERRTDIPALAMHFLVKSAKDNNKTVSRFAEDALQRLCDYDWPGNVRELENVMERAVVMAKTDTIENGDLPAELVPLARHDDGPRIPGASLEEIERFAILKTLELEGGSTSRAAARLGISVRKIQYKLQQYNSSPKGGAPAVMHAARPAS